MTQWKRKKRSNFVTISNIPFRDKNLSLKAKGLLGVIMTLPDNWNFTIVGIATCLKESTSAVSSAVSELIKNGYCVRDLVYDENHRISGYSYTFSDEKELLKEEKKDGESPSEEIPSSEKPSMENPLTEIPSSENQAQINNIKKEIKKNKGKEAIASKIPETYSSEDEKKFYEGMKSAYPFVLKMDFPLLYQDYVGLLAKYSAKKIHANLRKMNNWKELTKKKRFAKDVLEDWLAADKNEY